MADTPIEVTPDELRRMFNAAGYAERARRGDLSETVVNWTHPSPPLGREPKCTRSEIILLTDRQGNRVAEYHRYLRPDGSIGLSGLPDPKRVWGRNCVYIAKVPRPPAVPILSIEEILRNTPRPRRAAEPPRPDDEGTG